jgi:hypothetical protein
VSLNLVAYRKRKCVRTLTISESDGGAAVVASDDVVVFRICRGPLIVLEVASGTTTDEGSTVTATNPATLTLGAMNLIMDPGIYDLELLVRDHSEGNAEKEVDRGTLTLLETTT